MDINDKTIIITDPCYIVTNESDLEKCDYCSSLEKLGFTNFICDSTLFGGWFGTTYQTVNPVLCVDEVKEPVVVIGEYFSIIGLVAVFVLDEIVKYNPDFIIPIDCKWATVVPNFTGTVTYHVDIDENYHIIGIGNVNFITLQSGVD